MDTILRNRIEDRIILKLLSTAETNGWTCTCIDDGEERIKATGLAHKQIAQECYEYDEVTLRFRKGELKAWVFLVFGNSGWDVICDHSAAEPFNSTVMETVGHYANAIESGYIKV